MPEARNVGVLREQSFDVYGRGVGCLRFCPAAMDNPLV